MATSSTDNLINLVEAARIINKRLGATSSSALRELTGIDYNEWNAFDDALRPYDTLKAARPENVAEVTKILNEAFGDDSRVKVRGAALRIARLMG